MLDRDTYEPVVGVLLVHGLNGARYDMEELAQYLAAHGIVVENMLLPGHGTHVHDMCSIGWLDWASAVRSELLALKQRCDLVFLIGHSLGGALSLHIAAHEAVRGVVALCPPLAMFPGLGFAVRIMKYIIPLLPTVREDICDPEARKRYTRNVYRWTALAPVDSMMRSLPQLRAELPQITVPALIVNAVHDHVVPARDGREIYRLLGSKDKYLITLHRSYHVVMKDYEREEVFAKTLAFIHRFNRERPDLAEMEQSA